MEKGEKGAITERGFFCLGEGGFTFPLCHETVVYPKQKWYLERKKNNLLFRGSQTAKKNYMEPDPRAGEKGTGSPTLLSIYLSHYKLGYLYIFSRGKI